MGRFFKVIALLVVSSTSYGHSGGLDANGCHAGSQPYHCHRAPSEMVGNRLRCDLGSRSKECIGDRSINLPPANSTPSSRGIAGSSERAASAYVTKAESYSKLPMEKVINIQRRLRTLGIYDGKLDGIMGPQTALAIDVFKIKKGLPLDEELNNETLDVLGLEQEMK